MNFAERLNRLLENKDNASPLGKKVSQRELAAAVGCRPQTISLYVLGNTEANVSKLVAIAKFFHVSTDYLVGLSDTQNYEVDDRMKRALAIIDEAESYKFFERLKDQLK